MNQASNPDPMQFLKSLWGPMGIPLAGLVTPTLDVGELDKRIADLKSVETWLNTNLSMLRMSIQGLEMQRATLSAMQQGFGAAASAAGVAANAANANTANTANAAPAAGPAGAAKSAKAGPEVPPASANVTPLNPMMDAWWSVLQGQMPKPGDPGKDK